MKRQYNEAMDCVHMSDACAQRILEQASSNRTGGTVMRFGKNVKKFAIAAAMIAVLSSAAFAANVGGIRTTVKMWVNGQNRNIELVRDGNYNYTATIDGEERSFGGVSIDDDGTEKPLDAKDMEDLFAIDVEKGDDGTWTLYFYDRTIDITKDMENGGFDEKLLYQGQTYRIIVEQDGSFSVETQDDDACDETEADQGSGSVTYEKSVTIDDK